MCKFEQNTKTVMNERGDVFTRALIAGISMRVAENNTRIPGYYSKLLHDINATIPCTGLQKPVPNLAKEFHVCRFEVISEHLEFPALTVFTCLIKMSEFKNSRPIYKLRYYICSPVILECYNVNFR